LSPQKKRKHKIKLLSYYFTMDETQLWLNQAYEWLIKEWGLDPEFAKKISLLLLYFAYFGLRWTVTSGFRDPRRQRELQKAWDRGERAGLKTRPATNSLHSNTGFLGKPGSLAIDISLDDYPFAGEIAHFLGIGWGGDWKSYDPVHFYKKNI
jgi:hypothetical protein